MPGPANARGGSFRWADLRVRVLSAAALAPLAIAVVWVGGVFWVLLVLLAAILIGWEWLAMTGGSIALPSGRLLLGALAGAAVLAGLGDILPALLVLLGGFLTAWATGAVARSDRPAARRPFSLAAGVLYIGVAAVALIDLRADPSSGRANVLFVALLIWSTDVGAYAAGRLIGGRKLAPRISPGKTWSGAAGGLLTAIVVSYIVATLLGSPDRSGGPMWRVALVAAGLSAVAQAGDLFESALKRRFGVKDSGRLIPGHGGLLDRLDGFLAAGPVAAVLAGLLGNGAVLWQ